MYPAHRWSTNFFLVFIILLPILLFWRWIFKGEVLFWGTLLLQFWPWHHLVAQDILAGEWPLWNPLLGNGAPLLANLQTAVFYPFNLLYLLLPVEHGLTLSVVLHLVLAGLFMYLYTRRIGLLPFAATLSSLTFMLSGYIVGRAQFIPMVHAAAWYPLLLLLSENLATRRRALDVLWLGMTLAIQLLAGHAQLWFYGLWLIGPYIWFRTRPAKSRAAPITPGEMPASSTPPPARRHNSLERLKPKIQNVTLLGLAVGLAVLLSMAQLLPTAEFTTQSPRHSGAERSFALTYSFWPWRLLTLLAPNFFGHPAEGSYWGYANYWEDHAYLGVLPFLLALLAIWDYVMGQVWGRGTSPLPATPPGNASPLKSTTEPWRVVPFFAALVPISLVLAMGWNTPVYLWVFDFIPGFGFFQAPARLLIWYTVAMAVLAGSGVQYFKLTPPSRRGWQRLLVVALGLTLAGLAGSLIMAGRSLTFLLATTMLGLWLAVSALLLLRRPRPGSIGSIFPTSKPIFRKETLWQAAVLIFVAFDLLWAGWPLNPMLPAAIYTRPAASADFLKTQPGHARFFVDEEFDYTAKFDRYFRFSAFGPAEITYWQGLRETLIPNLGVYTGLASSNNYDPLVVGRWQRLVELLPGAAETLRARLLALLNVGYFIGSPARSAWPTLYSNEAMAIRQVPETLPRAYFVPQAYQAKDETEVIARLTSPDFDYHREVIIMEKELNMAAKTQVEVQEKAGAVTVAEPTPNQVKLAVTAPSAGFVVLTDTFYPGWLATVDGQSARIWPANLAFRAVAVEAGTHEIVFSYRPRSFVIGLWVSLITWVVVIGSMFLLKRSYAVHLPGS